MTAASWKGPHFATWHLEGVQPGCQVTVVDLGGYAIASVSIKSRWESEERKTCRTVPEAKAWAEEAAQRHGAIA